MQLVHSAFLASTAVSFPVFSSILIGFPAPSVVLQGITLDCWSVALPDVSPPSGDVACLQRAWDFPQVSAAIDLLCANTSSKACLQAVSAQESGLWLNALSLFFYGPSYG